MIANPLQMTAELLSSWAKELDNYVSTEAFSKLASEARSARTGMGKWVTDEDEWACTAGWNVLTHLTMTDDSLTDDYLENYINMIETYIHDSKNRVKYSMNNALIAIGIRRDRLETKAIAAAKRIGRVEVLVEIVCPLAEGVQVQRGRAIEILVGEFRGQVVIV